MVNTQTLSASRRGSDLSQRPLTHLYTLPPIRPDQSILAIPKEPSHGDICVCCLWVASTSFVTRYEIYGTAEPVTARVLRMFLKQLSFTLHPVCKHYCWVFCVYCEFDSFHWCFTEPGGLFWSLRGRKEGEVSGNREWMGHLHGNRSEHPCGE